MPRQTRRSAGIGTGTTASMDEGPHAARHCSPRRSPRSSAMECHRRRLIRSSHPSSGSRYAPSRTTASNGNCCPRHSGHPRDDRLVAGRPDPHRGHHEPGGSELQPDASSSSAGGGSSYPSNACSSDRNPRDNARARCWNVGEITPTEIARPDAGTEWLDKFPACRRPSAQRPAIFRSTALRMPPLR